jgi:hypothetical protein
MRAIAFDFQLPCWLFAQLAGLLACLKERDDFILARASSQVLF